MAGGCVNELQQLYFASRHGVLVNDNGGYYQRGKSYGMEVKLFVAAKYLDHKERRGGLRPVVMKVAAECRFASHCSHIHLIHCIQNFSPQIVSVLIFAASISYEFDF